MDAYEICKGCSCFVKRAEARCPFCGVEHVAARGAPRRIPRVSRAQWLAVASALTVTGCSGAVASPSGSSSSGGAGIQPEVSAACSAALQPFECGAALCNPATDYCSVHPGGSPIGCEPNDAPYTSFPAACKACPTCECFSAQNVGNCYCMELDGGGVGLACGACYGAPPARLERLSGRQSRRAPRTSPPSLLPS
jgi:hypothetical protein